VRQLAHGDLLLVHNSTREFVDVTVARPTTLTHLRHTDRKAFPGQDSPFSDRITGTPLFSSHRLHLPAHTHRLLDDLQSVLYVLIYVVRMAGCHGSVSRYGRPQAVAHDCARVCGDWMTRCAEQLRRSSSSCDASSFSLPMRPLLRLLPIQRSRSQYQ
jgi:hypothetical protein